MKKTDDNDLNNVVFEIKSVDPSSQISAIVDLHYATIMMSGTFFPVEDYELYYFGNNDRSEKCTLPNSFKSENRLVIGVTDVNTTLNCRNDSAIISNYEKCIKTIVKTHGNLGVFYHSYAYKKKYKKFILKSTNEVGKEYFDQMGNSTDEKVYNHFIDASKRNGGVLAAVCGGKFSEGLDYSGDLLMGAMVIGLPLVPPKVLQERKNEYYENLHGEEYGNFISYRLPAMNKALQAIGRVIRAKNETGILILADDRFTKNTKYDVNQYLPSWVRDEMIHCKSMEIEGVINSWVAIKKSSKIEINKEVLSNNINRPNSNRIYKVIRKEPQEIRNRRVHEDLSADLVLFKNVYKSHNSLIWKFETGKYDVKSLLEINERISKDIDSIENLHKMPSIRNVKSYLNQLSTEFKKAAERLLSERDNIKIRRELEYDVVL
ncbi:MAG: helicase C-terminal domain-containing protein [Methanosarcinaceae archaeon]